MLLLLQKCFELWQVFGFNGALQHGLDHCADLDEPFASKISFSRSDNAPKISKEFAAELRNEYDNFTEVFGELPHLRNIEIALYTGNKDYGGFNPNSEIITLRGIGGKNGKAFITNVAIAEKRAGQWSTSSTYHQYRHELAHALQKQMIKSDPLWKNKFDEIEKVRKSILESLTGLDKNDKIKSLANKLFVYGMMDTSEFISESVAEYVNNPTKARATAKQVVYILLGKG